jgi:hypothetical protein
MNVHTRERSKKMFYRNLPPIQLLKGGLLENKHIQKEIYEKMHIPANGVTFAQAGEITLLRDKDGVIFPPVQVWRQAGNLA